MQITDEMALRVARREANFDGYDCFEAMSRMSRERYIARSRAALEAALGAKELPLQHDIERHLAILSEKESCIEDLAGALRNIAAYDDKPASENLEKTGSWGQFDEPGGAQIARAALERWGLK